MNTATTQPTDDQLLRANLLGFVTHVKAASSAQGKNLTDADVTAMYKKASTNIQSRMAKQAKVRDIVLSALRPAAAAAPAAA